MTTPLIRRERQKPGQRSPAEYPDDWRKASWEEAIDKIKLNTRHYAKRQMTWFKKEKDIFWIDAEDKNLADKIFKRLGITK